MHLLLNMKAMVRKSLLLFWVICLIPDIYCQAKFSTANNGHEIYVHKTVTSSEAAEHPFCLKLPLPSMPRIPLYEMSVKTGFPNGYRVNQTVIGKSTSLMIV